MLDFLKRRAKPISIILMVLLYLSLQFLSPKTAHQELETHVPFLARYHTYSQEHPNAEKEILLEYLDELVAEVPKLNYTKIHDPLGLIENWESQTGKMFSEMNISDKAMLYTQYILPQSNFSFEPLGNVIYIDAFRKKKYMQERLQKWEEVKQKFTEPERNLLELNNDDWFIEKMKLSAFKKLDFNQKSSNSVKNFFSHYKIFSSIYLKSLELESLSTGIDYCKVLSSKLFPWLSGKLPLFYQIDEKRELKQVYPMDSDDELTNTCFVKYLQHKSTDRGIVFTASDQLVSELAGALSLLRITGNTYPIQIVHSGDLSESSMKKLHKISTTELAVNHDEVFKHRLSSELPPLELTFVDVSQVITANYKTFYTKYEMKLLAYLFNTFEEMILLDTDTVFFKPISHFFKTSEYQETGAYFFKDRDIRIFSFMEYTDYILTYLNSDQEENLLGIPKTGNDVLNNNFFGRQTRHLMESGLFVINRKKKFDGVLLATMLPMIKMISSFSHGDKELIWLGQAIAGNNFTFNSISSVSVGELTIESTRKASEVCSTHPAHINEKRELLWMNSGFFTCKKWKSYERDSQLDRNKGQNPENIRLKYISPLKITHAISPPSSEYFVISNTNEPVIGWQTAPECYGYTWCAYDRIGGEFGDSKINQGEVISFSLEQTEAWEFMGTVWVDAYRSFE